MDRPVQPWLSFADADLAAAEHNLATGFPHHWVTAFHAQQAVEKALKAAISNRGQEFPFTHDLGLLLQLCQDAGLEVPADLAGADELTPYAAAIRYGLGDPSAVPASDALRWAALAVEWVESELRSDS